VQALLEEHRFSSFREGQRRYTKEAADGTPVEVIDCCLIGEKKE